MPDRFRRANLRGSDELFRPTGLDDDPGPAPAPVIRRGEVPGSVRTALEETPGARSEGRLVRLTDEEVDILVDAIQKQKYPTATRVPTKPPMDVFERLEELRQKLLDHR